MQQIVNWTSTLTQEQQKDQRNWNEEFQTILARFDRNKTMIMSINPTTLKRPTITAEDAKERAESIAKISEEFANIATPFVKSIVAERQYLDARKSIKPIDAGLKKSFSNK